MAMVVALLLLGALIWIAPRRRAPVGRAAKPSASTTTPAADARIRVEVLNASSRRGLARHATLHLRDRGFDVVGIGNAAESRDSTVVIDRVGHPDWARQVSEALGGVPIESRPDSSRHVDVTVLLGGTWHAPPQPFYP